MIEGLDNIRDCVMKRANESADRILAEACSEAEDILLAAKEEQARLDYEQDMMLEQRRSRALTRARSMGELERRRIILEAKQNLIDETLEAAMTKLRNLSDDEREAFYLRLLRDIAADGQTIIFSHLDESIANRVIEKSGYHLKLGAYDDSFTGGFILEEGRVSWSFAFDAMLETDRETYVELIAETLYPSLTAKENIERDER